MTEASHDGTPPTMAHRERIVWATVFSVPPAVGMSLATAKVGATTILDPLVAGVFAVATTILFTFIYLATGTPGEADERRTEPGSDQREPGEESKQDGSGDDLAPPEAEDPDAAAPADAE